MKLNKPEQLFELFPFFLIVFLSKKKALFYIIKKNEQLLKKTLVYMVFSGIILVRG